MQSFLTISLGIFLSITRIFIGAEEGCVFCDCQVIEKQIVYENEYYRVLIDHAPRVKGHLMAIPKRHVTRAHELTATEWEQLSGIVSKVVMVFKEYLDTDQYIILEKNGPNAFRSVPHIHFHLMPITNQTFAEILAPPPKLSEEEISEQVRTFRRYFSQVGNSVVN